MTKCGLITLRPQVPNLLLNAENTVVIGHDTIFSTMSMSMEPEIPVTEVHEVDNWIKDRCYQMFEEVRFFAFALTAQ